MKTDIPKARGLLRAVLHRRNVAEDDRLAIIAALDVMTRHPQKLVNVVRNPAFSPLIKNRILQELAYEDTLELDARRPDVEIAVAAGLTPAGAARVSEVRNGVR